MAPYLHRESKVAVNMLKEVVAFLQIFCKPLVPSAILENHHRTDYLLDELHQPSTVLFFPLILGLILAMYKLTRVLDLNGRLSSVISNLTNGLRIPRHVYMCTLGRASETASGGCMFQLVVTHVQIGQARHRPSVFSSRA